MISHWRQSLGPLLVALFVLALDGMTKVWAERALGLSTPLPLAGNLFRLTLGYNTGVAFGALTNAGPGVLVLTGVIILGMLAVLGRELRAGTARPRTTWPLGLVLGGALANFADRLPDGRVTDFLDIGLGTTRWPSFNLADAAITLGVGILVCISIFARPVTDPGSAATRSQVDTEGET